MTKEDMLLNSLTFPVDKSKAIEALELGWKSSGFFGEELNKAIQCYFILKDLDSSKSHFYQCGIIDEFEILKLNSSKLDYGITHINYVMLSDCTDLINRFSHLAHSTFNKTINNGDATPVYIIQCILNNNWAEYERAIGIMKIKTLKKYPTMKFDLQVFEGIAENNKPKIEEALAMLVTPKIHNQRNKHDILIKQFISPIALGYAKLAWLKGIEVQVNSPLIPTELLPIQPLANYTNEYAFLYDIKLP